MESNCYVCGKLKKVVNHHLDYSKNVTLIVCHKCHKFLHTLQKQVSLPKKGKKATCHKCNYSWIYNGIINNRATCPSCLTKVNLNKVVIKK